MRTRIALWFVLGGGLLAFALLCLSATPVAAAPPLQTTPTPTPMSPPRAAALQDAPSDTARAPRLHGTVFDWGVGNMPAGVTVVLRGDAWEVPVQTDASGQYAFQDIGNEVAFLNASIPAERGDLFLLTSDLPVRVDVDGELIVNIAFYPKGVTPDPLVHLKMDASVSEVAQDEDVSYTVTVINYWDEGINQVIVADYMPEGLTLVGASASQGEVLYDRGLVWAEMGSIAAGESATVTVTARVDADVEPGKTILNKAAAYHSENAAVQNEAPITVAQRRRATDVLPVTGVSPVLPMVGVLLTGLLFGVRRLRRGLT
jgi:uncharacterized repeat protein (TIGR01451 family)